MIFPQLATLLTQGAFYSHACQVLLGETLDERLGAYEWQVDMSQARLSFVSKADSQTRLETTVDLIASIAPGPRSLLWGWASPQSIGTAAEDLRRYGQEQGIAALTDGELPLDTLLSGDQLIEEISVSAHEVGTATVGALGRAPYYSVPAGGGTRVVFLLGGDDLPKLTISPALPRYLMEATSTGHTSDHRTSFHWLAVYAGWSLSWDDAWTVAEVSDSVTGNSAAATFTSDALLSNVSITLPADA